MNVFVPLHGRMSIVALFKMPEESENFKEISGERLVELAVKYNNELSSDLVHA